MGFYCTINGVPGCTAPERTKLFDQKMREMGKAISHGREVDQEQLSERFPFIQCGHETRESAEKHVLTLRAALPEATIAIVEGECPNDRE